MRNRLGGRRSEARAGAPEETRGKGTRTALVAAAAIATLIVPFAATAQEGDSSAFVPTALLEAAQKNPDALFKVIVQADEGRTTSRVAEEVTERVDETPTPADQLRARFAAVPAVAATVTGAELVDLADDSAIGAITGDVPMVAADHEEFSNTQTWDDATRLPAAWAATANAAATPPAIAVVDTGIEAVRRDFSGRVVAQVSMSSLEPNASGDSRGHGTFVAGVAAGAAAGRAGGSPTSRIVALDVMDAGGKALTSDVIAAADWILQNRTRYNIRVANFSLHSSRPSSFTTDPLDKAVERLWLSGVVVVASAGNYAVDGKPSGVPFAPANDPFVITVGATDLGLSTFSSDDDFTAPWSAYGRTADGFLKPDLSAPGRGIIGAVPVGSTLPLERPDKVVSPGYMKLSGTSFSAPIVAGAAAQILAVRPRWTPDQVKGALMVSAKRVGLAVARSAGVGQVNARGAQLVSTPPNPNRALSRFLIADPAGGTTPVFDAHSWASAVKSDASWDSASWSDASWNDASWDSVSWADVSWADVSWADVSWADVSWADVSWVD